MINDPERIRLLDDLQGIAVDVTADQLRALLDRADAWMTDHPADLEVAATAELAAKLLAAYDAGLTLPDRPAPE